ncbi:MAG: hypothetical protein MMC33_006493 [Icmadophila ericetorum]|nr:hypothetical protein [Icmadophila ericetorum]
MAPFFANRSCDVWTPREWPCEMGNYVTYSLNVSESSQIVKGLAFAKEKNIRLVIRNTGHDYLGKSTGAGALAIWTHHLKDISIFDYKDAYYQGKAMKMGAGVQGFEAYKSADCHGLAVVGGECPSVGLAGGYTQGGGHSALSSMYGLGADQTLEFEVIDGSVNFLRASRAENEDLYWALSGGGGSTFGIVYSMTVKAHPDIPMTGARLAFQKRNGEDAAFWGAIEYYHSIAHTMSEVGGTTVCMFTSGTFDIMPLTVPGLSVSSVRSLLTPLTEKLSQLGIPYNIEVRQYPGFLQQHYAMFDFIAVGIAQYGGWLIPQSVIDSKNSELTSALREIVEDGNVVFGIGLNVSHAVTKGVYNSVHPAWRQAGLSAVVAAPWNESATWEDRIWQTKKMTEEWIPKLERIAPDSGCYMNEGDFQQKGWKKAFFGPNYEKLLTIKNRYDPDHIFYAINAVGSDFWKVEADGRLCPA